MAQLLFLGDSQVERVWNHVRGDRDLLRTGLFFPVKSRKAMDAGFKALKSNVSLCIYNLCVLDLYFVTTTISVPNRCFFEYN